MRSKVFFSIIIPTFNSEENISKCIESVLCQSFSDFEILIMDGMSSDNTINVLGTFNDNRIKIYSEKDSGVYDAMNKGIQLAIGKWLYFLGSDDVLYSKDVLSEIYNVMEISNYNVIYGNVLIDGTCSWAKDKEVYAGKFSFQRVLKKNICHQAIFYSREFILKYSLYFNLEFYISADWDLNIRSYMITNFKYINLIVAKFKGNGLSSKYKDDFYSYKLNNYNYLIKYSYIDLFYQNVKKYIKNLIK